MHDTNNNTRTNEKPSVLASLRALLPNRSLQFSEALRIAELQANRLLEFSGVTEAPVPSEIVTRLPRITIDYDIDMPFSGTSDWDSSRRSWVITLHATEPDTRHRLSILHEYKHIIDHGGPGLVDQGDFTYFGLAPEEYVAEYFAGCVLMPKRLVKQAWGHLIQRPADLAVMFDVSERAMQVRLAQLKLTDSLARCLPPRLAARRSFVRGRRPYHRQLSPNRPMIAAAEEITV